MSCGKSYKLPSDVTGEQPIKKESNMDYSKFFMRISELPAAAIAERGISNR